VIEVIFLGSGGVMPTKSRKTVSIVIRREGELSLFDCGEGCQEGFTWGGLGVNKPLNIFITHLHGDHILGLPGLLMSLDMLGRDKGINLIGPRGLTTFIKNVLEMTYHEVSYKISVKELGKDREVAFKGDDYKVLAIKVKHTVPCYAYVVVERDKPGRFLPEKALELGVPRGPLWKRLQRGEEVVLPDGRVIKPFEVVEGKRPGLKVVYSGDTRPCSQLMWAALGADLLIHEATFTFEYYLKAMENGHTTALEAGELASFSGVKRLALAHISPRYEGCEDKLASEASLAYDGEIIIAEDWLKLRL